MIALGQAKTKRLIALHGWSGIIISALLYVVVLSGTIAVFAHEIGTWSKGDVSVGNHEIGSRIDHVVRLHSRGIDPAYMDEVSISTSSNGYLDIFYHTHAKNAAGQIRDKGVRLEIDQQTGEVVNRVEGFRRQVYPREPESAFERFLVQLHIRLHIPGFWGLMATGILGLWMMISGISGILTHRHAIRDLFVPERDGKRLVSARDRHVLVGTWSLVFALLVAFTGTFYSFAGSIGLPVVGMVAFGGDQQAMIESVIGVPVPEDPTPTTLASLDYILMDATNRAGTAPDSITILKYGRADASVLTQHPPQNGDMTGTLLLFDGPSRAFQGVKPVLGTVPSAANTAFNLMGPLHFGHFAGFASKLIWLALGGAMCFVILSGTRLWMKRREDRPGWQIFRRILVVFAYGFPIALVASAYAHFLALPFGASIWWTPAAFVVASVVLLGYGWVTTQLQPLSDRLRYLLGLSLFGLPACRILVTGPSWGDAISAGSTAVPVIDLTLVASGAVLLWWPAIVDQFRPKAAAQPMLEPAE
ncbi:MAG: PepSY-associated TM helix domain-containing protein [Pseudomonadota bacterium]